MNLRYRRQADILVQSLTADELGYDNFFIGSSIPVRYDAADHSAVVIPDIFLVMDVQKREREEWVVWEEGMRYPDIIFEFAMVKERASELPLVFVKADKLRLYESVFKCKEYYLYDPFDQKLGGYHLAADGRYQHFNFDSEERVGSPSTGLYLYIKDGWLRWRTRSDFILPTPREKIEALQCELDEKQKNIERISSELKGFKQRAEEAEALVERYRSRFGNIE